MFTYEDVRGLSVKRRKGMLRKKAGYISKDWTGTLEDILCLPGPDDEEKIWTVVRLIHPAAAADFAWWCSERAQVYIAHLPGFSFMGFRISGSLIPETAWAIRTASGWAGDCRKAAGQATREPGNTFWAATKAAEMAVRTADLAAYADGSWEWSDNAEDIERRNQVLWLLALVTNAPSPDWTQVVSPQLAV